MSQDKKISFMINQEAASKLQAISDEKKVTQSELIRMALENYFITIEKQNEWLKLALIK